MLRERKNSKHGGQMGNSCVGAKECQASRPPMRAVRASCTLKGTCADFAQFGS